MSVKVRVHALSDNSEWSLYKPDCPGVLYFNGRHFVLPMEGSARFLLPLYEPTLDMMGNLARYMLVIHDSVSEGELHWVAKRGRLGVYVFGNTERLVEVGGQTVSEVNPNREEKPC